MGTKLRSAAHVHVTADLSVILAALAKLIKVKAIVDGHWNALACTESNVGDMGEALWYFLNLENSGTKVIGDIIAKGFLAKRLMDLGLPLHGDNFQGEEWVRVLYDELRKSLSEY